jgi:biotin transport system substrate-specific component
MNMKKNKSKLNEGIFTQTHALTRPDNTFLIATIKVMFGVFALFAAAQILIPIKPIPITLQTIVVSIIGLSYSPRLSFATLLAYLTLGALGAPMFLKYSGGLGYMSGMTAGYLLGFLIAAPTISYLKQSFSRKFLGVMSCCMIGHAIIYVLGVSWLASFIGLEKAMYSGFLIYLPSGVVKITILSYLYSYINSK